MVKLAFEKGWGMSKLVLTSVGGQGPAVVDANVIIALATADQNCTQICLMSGESVYVEEPVQEIVDFLEEQCEIQLKKREEEAAARAAQFAEMQKAASAPVVEAEQGSFKVIEGDKKEQKQFADRCLKDFNNTTTYILSSFCGYKEL